MSHLLPDNPDYLPMPSLTADMAKAVSLTSFALAVGLEPLCPVPHHDGLVHVPHQDFVDPGERPALAMVAASPNVMALTGVSATGAVGTLTPVTS